MHGSAAGMGVQHSMHKLVGMMRMMPPGQSACTFHGCLLGWFGAETSNAFKDHSKIMNTSFGKSLFGKAHFESFNAQATK
jgi:hypothetical protein